MRGSKSALLLLTVTLAATLVAFRPAEPVGPPWLSLEAPANPLNPATGNYAFVIRTYRHAEPQALPITGVAVGIVDGQRLEIPLEFESVGGIGVFGVTQTWPSEGQWVVTIRVADGAALVIELAGNGGIDHGSYYGKASTSLQLASVEVMENAPSQRQITSRLNSLALAASR